MLIEAGLGNWSYGASGPRGLLIAAPKYECLRAVRQERIADVESARSLTKFCFVTHDLEKAVQQWAEGVKAGPFYVMASAAGFFGERSYRGSPARDNFKAALGFSGNTLIEFIEPTNDEPSVFQEVLTTKGDMAVHHVYPDMRPIEWCRV